MPDPRIRVMMVIGIKEEASFRPMMNTLGRRHRKEIKMPFGIGFIFRFVVPRKKPTTTHIEKADRLASQVNP